MRQRGWRDEKLDRRDDPNDPEYYRANAREYKRAKREGVPVPDAPSHFKMTMIEISKAIKEGTLKTRCVRGRRVIFRPEESNS